MRSLSLSILMSVAGVLACAGSPSAVAAQSGEIPEKTLQQLRAEAIRSGYAKFEYRIPARDGTLLFTSVYVPNDAGPGKRYPILLTRTPYSVAPYGADRYKASLGPTRAYEDEGYIFVFQDVRGQHMSEGTFVNMRPALNGAGVDESTDTWDTIDWLVKRLPGNNGRVGMWGVSYPGFYTAIGAIDSHRALKAISPQAPIANWFLGDDMHRHGAFNLQLAFGFFSGFGLPRPAPTDDETPKPFDYGTPDGYQYLLDLGPLSNVAARFKGPVAFWDDVVAHPDYDAFWQARDLPPRLKNIRAAVLTVGGWYDTEDLYGPLRIHEAIGRQNPGVRNHLIVGPWTHGGWLRGDGDRVGDASFGFATSKSYQPVEFAFFQHWLKGGPDPKLAGAWMFETGANRWRTFDAWPPKAAQPRALYLQADSGLAFDAPTAAGEAFDEYVSDPAKPVPYTAAIGTRWSKDYVAEDQRFAARRPDVLVYRSAPLEHDVTIAGPLEASLWVSTTGTDADWVVKLIDVNPGKMPGYTKAQEDAGEIDRGGQQTLVRGEPFRGRYRESYEHPVAFVPGQPTAVDFRINDVFHTFQRGHRIMVQVQSSWFPFIDRNPQTFVPNIYRAQASDFRKATHRVYHDATRPSALKVRVLSAADAR